MAKGKIIRDRRRISVQTQRLFIYLLANRGNEVPPSRNLPGWSPWQLNVTKTAFGDSARDSRRRALRALNGSAEMTAREERQVQQRLQALVDREWDKFRASAQAQREEIDRRGAKKEYGEIGTVSDKDFKDRIEKFLTLNFQASQLYVVDNTSTEYDEVWQEMIETWVLTGLGIRSLNEKAGIDWPAY